jgi:hypothetical protein
VRWLFDCLFGFLLLIVSKIEDKDFKFFEQDAIKIFSLPNIKISLCAFSLYELNLALTQQILAQHEKKCKILSLYPI